MTGIEKTVTNRSGAGVLVLCAILFACAPVRKMLPIRQESGIAVRTSTGWHVPMLPVSRLATKDISVEVTTGKQPVWPIPGSMTSTMTGGRNVPICPVRFGMPLQVSRWGIRVHHYRLQSRSEVSGRYVGVRSGDKYLAANG